MPKITASTVTDDEWIKRELGVASSTCVIAEVAQTHDGSLGQAHAFIDAVATTGADAIKFQTHIAEAESTPDEPWRVEFSTQDESRYEYWRRISFDAEQWAQLKRHSDERGLHFLSSPFSIEALELLEKLGVPAWKIASGETGNPLLIDRIISTGKPIFVSTGMSPLDEIDATVAAIRKGGNCFAVLQCTSIYPTPLEKVGLNMLQLFRERYGCPMGLSDHSGVLWPSIAAAAMGASVLEVHVTFSRRMFGPDVPASLTVDELGQLVQAVHSIKTMNDYPVDKDEMAIELEEMRLTFTKSLVARKTIKAGTLLTSDDLAAKKPGTGIPVSAFSQVIGRRALCDIAADTQITESDLAPSTAKK